MTSQANSKVRMVRCPKCRHVLREQVEVPVYMCGGCGAILQAKKRDKDPQDTKSQVHEADHKHKNELENTSEKPIIDESLKDKIPKWVDSVTEDRMGVGINHSNQFSRSDAISCHEIEGSSPEARTCMEEEEGKLSLDQYGTEDHNTYRDDDKESEKCASNKISSSSELNHHESNSLVPQSSNYESESLLSSLEKETQSRHSSLKYNFDGDKKVSEKDLENATDNPSAGKETESQRSSEDNCDGGKRKFENELQNTSEKPSSGISDLENVLGSITEHRMEPLGGINQSNQFSGSDVISCHDIEGSLPEARTRMKEEEGKLPLYLFDDDKESEKSASNEISSSPELNHHESNSLVSQSSNYESESLLSSLEKETQSRHSSLKYNFDGDKEVSEKDLENATDNPSAGKETESQRSSEDNCDGGKRKFEIELQNTSINPSSGKSDLVHTEADKCETFFDQSGTEVHNKSRNDNKEQSGDVSISNKVLSSPKINQLENDSTAMGYHMYESDESLLSSPNKVTGSGYLSPTNNDGGEDEDSSQVEGVEREVDENRKSLSILTSANAEFFLDTVTKDQIITANSFSSEGVLLDKLMSPQKESMQQVESGMVPGFRSVSSDDTLQNMPYFYAKGDLGVTLRSSTARNYYASDGSASSNEIDDQVPDRRFQLLKRSLKDVGPNSTKVPERSEYKTNHVTCNESELQRQPMISGSFLQGKKHSTTKVSRWHQDELLENTRYKSPVLQGKKHSTTKVSRWHQDELLESTRYRSPVRNTIRNETDDYHPRLLFSKYGSHSSQADQGNSSSSNYGKNEFSALHDNPQELHRLELLRMVYALQDQLRRTQISEGMPHGRFLTRPSKGKEHHFAENRKNYSDLAYHNYHGKYSRDITWLRNKELSRMILPEDPTHYMHRVDCSCLRCCSQQQHPSAQLPPHAIYFSEEQYMANARQTSRPHHSASSSPQHYATSEFSLWSHDMKSDDQWYKKHKEAQIHHIAKRHFQPIAGGAPIVACYHCSEMLQLPAESLLFKRRCHQLRCGACSEVLKFSLENKIHVVRYDLIPTTPPPSEIANNTRVIKKSNLALAYRGSDRPLSEPASSSDNSQSFSRSYSTGDNFSATPRKMSSASSFETRKEGMKSRSTRELVNKNKNSVESFKAAGSSSKMPDTEHSCSESEVESPLSGSTLHKLMGYSSIRRLVYQ